MSITDKEISNILKDITIICDTREKNNNHILTYFKEQNLPYIIQKLDTADYSFFLPNYKTLGLDKLAIIEKKNSLDEIAGNFTKDRERFVREFERVTPQEHIHLVIENATWKKLLNGTYRSQLGSQAFVANLLTWNIRYNCPIWFTTPAESPMLIYNLIRYELFEKLKQMRSQN